MGGYETYGQTENYMPYYRSDDQFQYVVNANWLLGRHNIRFGTDVYLQQLNHTQPETTGTSYGARGGFTFGNGPTRIPSVSGTQFHSWAAFLLGLPTELGRRVEVRRLASWFNDKFFAEVSGPLVMERFYKRHMRMEQGGGSPDIAALD